MLTEEQAAEAYREMTDSTRDLLRVRHDARRECRIKPDPEVNPLAELDYEEGATWDELVLTTPERVRRTDRIAIQPLAPFAPPTGTGGVAAM